MEAVGDRTQAFHDALYVDDHRVNCTGDQGQFLLQEVAGQLDALAQQRLVGGAAEAGEVDAPGTLALRIGDQLGILHCGDDHLGQGRLMAVYDEVDHVFFQHAEIGLGQDRRRGAEEHVGEIGAEHRTAPAVGQSAAHGLIEDVFGILIIADIGAMHGFDHFAVDVARGDVAFFPDLLALGGARLR